MKVGKVYLQFHVNLVFHKRTCERKGNNEVDDNNKEM
jgi:hypothetical protein